MAGASQGRRRAVHSLEAVIGEAIALLDEAGEGALTFRALASRLGGGVASIYWYVSSKDELLDRATDQVVVDHLERTEDLPRAADPLAGLRELAVALFDDIRLHPWMGKYMMRDAEAQPHVMIAYERLGEQVMRLDMSPRDTFHAVSAVLGFVIGTAIDLGQEPPAGADLAAGDRDSGLEAYAETWRALDPEKFPYIHLIIEEFVGHDDAVQFRAGLDLILEGLRRTSAGEPGADD
ncbi:TetR family transcriptional regulator [Brachybacterium endophyticum]|uniref:TetR family transcriptional regulator n=1 Tax=Brachybacterium endophyticum TaxID=2182385 RepID=A0A2U2RLZ1_9MICO|nr:TetR/AcrR family transcriptional regulator C-terminal domain-containing protein [Brachybacterium endophyticum]PWH06851.1 TetR family transcriptional regulator [Brachybacterium endophyticum]